MGEERIKANKTSDPIAIGTLRSEAVVLEAHHIAHLLEEFFGLRSSVVPDKMELMNPPLSGGTLKDKGIRRNYSVKQCGIMPPISR